MEKRDLCFLFLCTPCLVQKAVGWLLQGVLSLQSMVSFLS